MVSYTVNDSIKVNLDHYLHTVDLDALGKMTCADTLWRNVKKRSTPFDIIGKYWWSNYYNYVPSYWGHSRYWSILASWIDACPFFPTPLKSPSTLLSGKIRAKLFYWLLMLNILQWIDLRKFTHLASSPCSSNTTISSTQNTTQARAICPARYVRSSADWALSRTEPGRATLTV